MALNWGEERVREAIAAHFDDRLLTIGRAAVLTQPHNGRAACHYCESCYRDARPERTLAATVQRFPLPMQRAD